MPDPGPPDDRVPPAAPPSGPRRWAGLLAAVALVSGGVAYTVEQRHEDARNHPVATRTVVPGPPKSTKPTRVAAAIAARRLAVDTILIRRAQAVQTGNEALFLADVDPANQKLRAAQKILFANLVEIGFNEIGYSQAEERFNPAVVQAHGRTTYLVRIPFIIKNQWMNIPITRMEHVWNPQTAFFTSLPNEPHDLGKF